MDAEKSGPRSRIRRRRRRTAAAAAAAAFSSLVVMMVFPPASVCEAACPPDSGSFAVANGKTYLYYLQDVEETWSWAKDRCESQLGMVFARFYKPEMAAAVKTLIGTSVAQACFTGVSNEQLNTCTDLGCDSKLLWHNFNGGMALSGHHLSLMGSVTADASKPHMRLDAAGDASGAAPDDTGCAICMCVEDQVLSPVNGAWSDWTDSATGCSVTCGTGLMDQTRSCTNPSPSLGGADCPAADPTSQSVSCDTGVPCPVHGAWTDWTDSTACSITCGTGGTKTQERTCTNPASADGGAICPISDPSSRSVSCDAAVASCAVDGGWTDWADASTCSVTCGTSTTKTQERFCTNPAPADGGAQCPDLWDWQRFVPCDGGVLCDVDGAWSDWTDFTACSVTCGAGTKRRDRACTNPAPEFGGADCPVADPTSEIVQCTLLPVCPCLVSDAPATGSNILNDAGVGDDSFPAGGSKYLT